MIAYAHWLTLDLDVRLKIAKIFGIKRTDNVMVTQTMDGQGNTKGIVQSDGFNPNVLLQGITIHNMQGVTKSTLTDFDELFALVVTNVDAILDGTYKVTKNDETKIKTSTKQNKSGKQKAPVSPKAKTELPTQPGGNKTITSPTK